MVKVTWTQATQRAKLEPAASSHHGSGLSAGLTQSKSISGPCGFPRDGSQESKLAWSGAQGPRGCDYSLQGTPRAPMRVSVIFPLACWEKLLEQG